MKQEIVVPAQMTPTFFNHPCIEGAYKDQYDGVRYLIRPKYTYNGDYMTAYPGDSLVEYNNGKWNVISKKT